MNPSEDRDRIVSRFREGPVLLEQMVGSLQDAELDFKPSSGGWSIRQIVHHVVDGDDIWKFGIKMAIGNEQAEFSLGWYTLQTQDAWADQWAYHRRSIGESLSLLKAIRAHLLQLLESIPDAWDRVIVVRAQKEKTEKVTIGFVFQMQADHVFHHLERIKIILQEARGAI